MAGSVNKVILVGNLGRTGNPPHPGRPADRQSQRRHLGKLARQDHRRAQRKTGGTASVFNEGLCKVIEQYLKKGSKVYLEGALQTRKWTDKDGHDKYSTEVVLQGFNSTLTMLDTRGGGGGASAGPSDDGDFGSPGPTASRERKPAMAGAGKRDDMDDEIPF